jgi:aminobenzoyl-glutamate utilization protein B
MLAATAVKDWLAAHGIPGRVRYYGCPAEEGGAAKTFMVRDGVFADVDAAISWHPAPFSGVNVADSLAIQLMDFSFTGRASHAAAAPHLGRSALDAVELMNIGVNYMREHMPSDARVHYALLDTGGIAPNVVQAHARVRYSIRARDLPGMNELVGRVHKIAQGAALMTETKVEMKIISAVSNILPNTPLEQALHGIMEELGPPHFDDTDKNFAQQIQSTLTDKDIETVYYSIGMDPTDRPLADFIVPLDAKRNPQIGSTDVGDVSWVVPTVQVHAPTVAIGTPFHTWQVVAQGKSPHAHKAMVQAAKAMAGLGVRALTEPDLIAAAKADLNKRTTRTPYVSPLPDSVAPPLDMSRI